MNKILFLDFDGVINCIGDNSKNHKNIVIYHDEILIDMYDQQLSKNVNILCEKFDMSIVISSTWRNHYSMVELREILNAVGIYAPLVGVTTSEILDHEYKDRLKVDPLELSNDRGLQIKKYIESNSVIDYIIVDDDPSAGIADSSRFVKCNPLYGFNSEKLNESMSILEKIDMYNYVARNFANEFTIGSNPVTRKEAILKACKAVGMEEISSKTGIPESDLNAELSDGGDLSFGTVVKIMKYFGLKIKIGAS